MSRYTLSEDQIRSLRLAYPYWKETGRIIEIAHRKGWAEANITFLNGVREDSREEMRELMREVNVEAAETPSEALDLIELACRVFAPEEGFSGSLTRSSADQLRIDISPCPEFQRLEEQAWCGVTVCTGWHRRHGWYDALGVRTSEDTESESGWDNPGCVTVVEVESVQAPQAV